jgi:L-ascorbate metabolism protein UlaG (beta-lactamase superfamily)
MPEDIFSRVRRGIIAMLGSFARRSVTMRHGFRLAALVAAVATVGVASAARAQPAAPAPPAKPEMRENCPGLVASAPPRAIPRVLPAALRLAALAADQVRITYVGHATFLIESPQLVRIATDYNDYVRPLLLPDVVTMNHAHSTHFTGRPDPGIKLVLRGWRDDGGPTGYDVNFKDVRIRSIATNIRTWGGDTERNGNSIFVFEIAGLCIAHLGHLHHTLTQPQLDELGRMDVVMAPVDGSYTLDLDGMVEVLQSLHAQVVIPMHFFNTFTLERFITRMRQSYEVERSETPSLVVAKKTLPAKPTVVVLPGH